MGLFLVTWSVLVVRSLKAWYNIDLASSTFAVVESVGLLGGFLVAYALISAWYWWKYKPSQDKSKGEAQPVCQGEPGKDALDDALLADYEGAWKQMEYYMSTNWQVLVMLLSLAGAANLVGGLFRDKATYNLFIQSSIVAFILLGILYFFFFHRNATLGLLHSMRRLEIEAFLGMRANWREYLDRGELHSDIERWAGREEVSGILFEERNENEAADLINSNTRSKSPNDLLPRIASQKRKEVQKQWQIKYKWMSAIYLVYAGGAILVAWALWIIYLWSIVV